MQEKHPKYGENAHYDAQVERESAARRALELTVVERHRQEQELIEARKALVRAKEAQEKARIVYQQDRDRLKTKEVLAKDKYDEAKAAVLAAKRAVTEADQALRSGRRAYNSRMQAEARERGDKTYLTGSPCRNGHAAHRYVSSGACVECDRIGWINGRLASREVILEAQL
jgi:hypothetical protein